jgi:uncharacterized protein YigE (DUF2233 family)
MTPRRAARILLAGWLALTGLAGSAGAVTCRDMVFEGTSFTACEVDPATEDLALHWGRDGQPYGTFRALEAGEGDMAFAMNAGMYHEERSPVGLFLQDGIERSAIALRPGPGNFGLLPNGVFCIEPTRARVIESRRYADAPPPCRDATQSGPALVLSGKLHPRLKRESDSLNIRNGVGTSSAGDRVVFAISNERVNFHRFARFFRDHLGLDDALYFDGRISRLHAPMLGRSDAGLPMGPMVGVRD